MAVGNSLTSRTQKQGLTAYLAQDAVKNQINSIIGGKMEQGLFPVLYLRFRPPPHCRSAQTPVY